MMLTDDEIRVQYKLAQMVKIATGEKIIAQYLQNQDRSFAMRIASAIINDLMSLPNPDPEFQRFEEANKALISEIMVKLRKDQELKDIISQTVRAQTNIKAELFDAAIMKDPEAPMKHLETLGILVKGECPYPPSYIQFATRYCEKYLPEQPSQKPPSSKSGCLGALFLLAIPSAFAIAHIIGLRNH